ncbi:hypothetical protein HN512_04045 [Candidatus Peregrinibacteria bacterium]|jgi:hypothetical protein|nr:hypothetical protein [Candidatus Peregrinibacteria bacterium]MBT3598981.1 hypothetical protein [Candidatus Peregrinibacteria bacterium]MBT4585493.1 hypothetical protein [Candidatus Peregrinibacteria bacterium]MBT6731308.1 hypothetical protein [Candidatus Peregrinibacteria bacterium]MBT7009727.1 hypothetical protein [Candidatus Peregrinibacteria bacterium]
MNTFTFWWSIISSVISLIFVGISIWQYFIGRNAKQRQKAQVKIWMQNALGLREGLKLIMVNGKSGGFTSPVDVANAVWSLEPSAFALYQSLYEERCIKEKEYIQKQKIAAKKIEEANENS